MPSRADSSQNPYPERIGIPVTTPPSTGGGGLGVRTDRAERGIQQRRGGSACRHGGGRVVVHASGQARAVIEKMELARQALRIRNPGFPCQAGEQAPYPVGLEYTIVAVTCSLL